MKEKSLVLREKILEAAVALFIEKGLENVKTRDLTDYLGLSRSHIYHYFSDWTTLCLEACHYFVEKDASEFDLKINSLLPNEQLNAFISNYLPVQADAIWQLYSAIWNRAMIEPAYAELVAKISSQWIERSAAIIHKGIEKRIFREVNGEQVARQLAAMLNGYSDYLIVFPGSAERAKAMEDIYAFTKQVLL